MPPESAKPTRRPLPRIIWPLLALAVLLIVNAFLTPQFFHFGSVTSGDGTTRLTGTLIDVLDSAPLLITALGMTLVIATGGIDLSVGSVLAIAGVVAAVLITQDVPVFVAVGAALGVALLFGAWNGVLVAAFGIQPIVATLVLMVAGRGVAMLLSAGQVITFQNAALQSLGSGQFLALPAPVWFVLLAYAIAALVLRGSALGLLIAAVGENERASRVAGIRVWSLKLCAYTLAGGCAGLAGVIHAADVTAADPNLAGLYLELDAILAVVIGGTALTGGRFTLAGTLLGALLIETLDVTFSMHAIPSNQAFAIKGAVVIVVCLLQSERLRDGLKRFQRRVFARAQGGPA
jgi:galactofuranose transport system permease protein